MFLLSFTSAFAAPPESGVTFTHRPPTLPHNDVRIVLDGEVGVQDPNAAGVALGAAVGVTDQFEIGAWLVPLTLNPDVVYEDPSLYVAYGGELSKTASLTPMLRLSVPVSSTSAALFDAQLKLAVDLGKSALLSIAPTASLHFVDGGPNVGFGAPLNLALEPSRRFFLMLESGVGTDPFSWRYQAVRPPGVAQILVVPAGVQIGTIAGKPKSGAVVDLSVGAYWPALVAGSVTDANNVQIVAQISTDILGDRKKAHHPAHHPAKGHPAAHHPAHPVHQ